MGGSSRHQTRTAVCRVMGCVGDCDVAMSHGACVRRSPLFSGENSAQMLRTLERMPFSTPVEDKRFCILLDRNENKRLTRGELKPLESWKSLIFNLFNGFKRGMSVKILPFFLNLLGKVIG